MEEQDRPYDPDLAKDAAGALMVVDAEDPQARPVFYAFAARRTPVLPLTSALWGSAFPSGQAGSPRRLLQTFIPTRFQFLGDWNYQS